MGRTVSSSPSLASVAGLTQALSLPQCPHLREEGLGSPVVYPPPQPRRFGLQGSRSPSSFFSPQAAPGPRAFCVPRIILTECAPNPPSPPEPRPEEPSPRTTPTPRPRTLVGSGRDWDGPQALPGVVAEASGPSSSLMPEKEGTSLKSLGTGGCSPEEGGVRVSCPRGPAPDTTQEPSPAETHLEETPKDSGRNAQPCSGNCKGQPAVGSGCTVRGATSQRMDSLEESLRELEATLSQMGTAPPEGSPGSPPPPPPTPKVAASSPVLPSCLHAPVSPPPEQAGVGGCRSTDNPSPRRPSVPLLGAWCPVDFAGRAPGGWEAGLPGDQPVQPRQGPRLLPALYL